MAQKGITKDDIRREIRGRRRRLEPNWVAQASDLIQAHVLGLAEWIAAQRIFCYLAAPAEVQTGRLLDACRQAGKCVWVPAFRPEPGGYACVRLEPGAALIAGRRGIREPAKPAWDEPERIDLVIAPGLAFDLRGKRLGHGGGHYDRLLAQPSLNQAFKIGLAFAFQLRELVPTAAHDAGMDIVVTEEAVIRCGAEHNRH